MAVDPFDVVEQQTRILGEIAAAFPEESRQYVALHNAALALVFAMTEHYDDFVDFVRSGEDDVSDEQRQNLRDWGLL